MPLFIQQTSASWSAEFFFFLHFHTVLSYWTQIQMKRNENPIQEMVDFSILKKKCHVYDKRWQSPTPSCTLSHTRKHDFSKSYSIISPTLCGLSTPPKKAEFGGSSFSTNRAFLWASVFMICNLERVMWADTVAVISDSWGLKVVPIYYRKDWLHLNIVKA